MSDDDFWNAAPIATKQSLEKDEQAKARANDPESLIWKEAATGLDLYERALLVRLALPLVGFFLLLGRFGLESIIKWTIAIGVPVASVAMLVGVTRYARLPGRSGARTAALGAAVLMVLSVLLELATVLAATGEPEADTPRVLTVLLLGSYVLGFGSLLCLLFSFVRVAASLRVPGIRKAARLATFALLVELIMIVGLRVGLPERSRRDTVLGAMMVIVVVGVLALLGYLRTLRATVDALGSQSRGELEPAPSTIR